MKKLFAIVAIAAVFTACNNSTEPSAEDIAKKVADSTHIADSTASAMKMQAEKMMNDSNAKKMVDTVASKMDKMSDKMDKMKDKMDKKDK
jgi:gas vesicle protein